MVKFPIFSYRLSEERLRAEIEILMFLRGRGEGGEGFVNAGGNKKSGNTRRGLLTRSSLKVGCSTVNVSVN